MDILKLLLVYFILCISYSNGGILSSQCKARCITNNVNWKTSTLQAIADCDDDINCSSCLLPCLHEYKTQASCKYKCSELAENEEKCIESCDFLKLKHYSKIGICPKPTDATGFAKTCLPTCGNDSDCERQKKCCFNGCGRTCQDPVAKSEDLPSKPRNRIKVVEVPNTREIDLSWTLRSPEPASDIIYFVIQGRNNTGHHPSKNRMDTWYHVADTVENHYKLKAKPGVFYEFQIASVNLNGTLGFNRPSEPFTISVDPEPPHMPQNLRVGESKIVNNTVTCRIYWDPPKESDVEVTRYRVFWSARLSTISLVYLNLEEHRRNVPADQSTYAIEGLLPNTKYFIQVAAIAQWGSTRLRSNRTSIYTVTIDTDQPGDQPVHEPVDPWHPYYPLLPTPPPVRDIKQNGPAFWSNNSLNIKIDWRKPLHEDHGVNRYMLYWLPTVCVSFSNKQSVARNATSHWRGLDSDWPHSTNLEATTHSLEFMLYGLMFDCRYKVVIHSVDTNFRRGPSSVLEFYTPLCNEVIVKGKQKPVCPTPAPDVPSKPMDLSHRFSLGVTLTLELEWNLPVSKSEMVTGYRLTWGERDLPAGSRVVERFEMIKEGTALTKTLPKDHRWFTIGNLISGVQYVIQVQSLCGIGGGGVAVIIVKPPQFYDNTPLPPTSYSVHLLDGNTLGPGGGASVTRPSISWFFLFVLLVTLHWLRS